jgi:hypothetical protein
VGIAVGIGAFLKVFQSGGGQEPVTLDLLRPLVSALAFVTNTMDDVMRDADHESTIAADAGNDAGNQIGEIGLMLKDITLHTYDTVIPGSLSWLRGDIIVHDIDPIRMAIRHINKVLSELIVWQHDTDKWRHHYVDPNLAQWIAWYAYWKGWPRTTVETVAGWLQHPDNFATFAVPAIAKPLVDYYSASPELPLLETLTATILSAVPDDIGTFVTVAGELLETNVPNHYAP